jgi:hypothetical protein
MTYIRKDGSRFPAVVAGLALRYDQSAMLICADNTVHCFFRNGVPLRDSWFPFSEHRSRVTERVVLRTSLTLGTLAFGAVAEKKESPRVKVGFALNKAVFRDANAVQAFADCSQRANNHSPCSAAMTDARREPRDLQYTDSRGFMPAATGAFTANLHGFDQPLDAAPSVFDALFRVVEAL